MTNLLTSQNAVKIRFCWYFLNIHRAEKRFTPKLLHMKVIYTSISAIICDDGFCESDKDRLNLAWFQASAAVQMISSLFWDVMQRRLVVTDVSGQPIGPIFKSQSVQEEMGPDMLSRNVGNYLPIYAA